MTALAAALCSAILGQGPPVEPEHAANPVYRELRERGLAMGGAAVPFPGPILRDDDTPEQQKAALRKVAGSAAKANDLVRDSVTAPFILRPRDRKLKDGSVVRMADLWFVVHGDFDAIDPAKVALPSNKSEPFEAGNMRFEGRSVTEEERKAREVEPLPDAGGKDGPREWYVHLTSRLLDQVEVEATDRVVASRTPGSLVVASRSAPEFGREGPSPNLWRKIFRNAEGRANAPGPAEPYAGGGGYVKISKYKPVPGALLVESHFAFAEPKAWFDGAPILRSKFGLVAQDRIRALRRELAKGTAAKGPR